MRTKARVHLLLACLVAGLPGGAIVAHAQSERLVVDQARDGRFFIINGIEFQAREICRRVKTGDYVTFLTGSSDGRCTFASFLDLNTGESCDVWCQAPLRQMP